MLKSYQPCSGQSVNAAIFLSGSGSNAENLLNYFNNNPLNDLNIVALVTDRPKQSRAHEIGKIFDIPVVSLDIKYFYTEHGLKRVNIMTEEGVQVREQWTNALRALLAPYDVQFGIFAGFIPLCNITGDMPCLNVHPGDLTYLKDGERFLVGLHTIPVDRAILEGLSYMRSSVIVAEPFLGFGENMDAGHILGVSGKVTIDLMGHDLNRLREIARKRPSKRPLGGYKDLLNDVANHNQELLKIHGDWVVLPQVVADFAKGLFSEGVNGELLYRGTEVVTVTFQNGQDSQPIQS